MSIFHLAIPSHDLALSKEFYVNSFGAIVGREYGHYVIFNFFGHQVVAHLDEAGVSKEVAVGFKGSTKELIAAAAKAKLLG